jgi:hypothetical protein
MAPVSVSRDMLKIMTLGHAMISMNAKKAKTIAHFKWLNVTILMEVSFVSVHKAIKWIRLLANVKTSTSAQKTQIFVVKMQFVKMSREDIIVNVTSDLLDIAMNVETLMSARVAIRCVMPSWEYVQTHLDHTNVLANLDLMGMERHASMWMNVVEEVLLVVD